MEDPEESSSAAFAFVGDEAWETCGDAVVGVGVGEGVGFGVGDGVGFGVGDGVGFGVLVMDDELEDEPDDEEDDDVFLVLLGFGVELPELLLLSELPELLLVFDGVFFGVFFGVGVGEGDGVVAGHDCDFLGHSESSFSW